MSSVSAIALSGMNAALLRLNAAASNIANARSNGPLPGAAGAGAYAPPYSPFQVVQTFVPGGGTAATVVRSPLAPVVLYDPSAPYANAGGMIAAPDVDLAAEIVNLVIARNNYAANLAVMRTDYQMLATLLDIKA